MHLIWENVMKNLMQLWTGQYKDLDCGSGDYRIEPTIWDAIGAASAESGNYVPYIFGPRPPNVASDKTSWTADTRSFWTQYVGPVLLERRFKARKYYDHFVLFVKLIRRCLQFEISQDEIAEVRNGFVQWVLEYEEFYYQYDPDRLSTCPVTIHALLHIADSIQKSGPVWASWAFVMERYCGMLQPAIQSRRFPYSSLNRYVLDHARLTQIKLMYGPRARSQLNLNPPTTGLKGRTVPGYDTCVLLPAHHRVRLQSDRGLTDKIIGALRTRMDTVMPHLIRRALPDEVDEWGKLRILNDGDTIRAAAMEKSGSPEDKRDATYVRYEVLVDQNARHRNLPIVLQPKTLYGQLQRIFEIQLSPLSPQDAAAPSPIILAAIHVCDIQRSNNNLDIHYYTRMGRVDYVDITTIQCVVGRIKDRGQFAIIDRSGTLSRAIYLNDDT
ncbi:hypothetical protein C2E23DRAFT_742220 [Lenzites betulinus]|nr:hypothetical protein C2E23DRAFT_742220 [Lenzites betulinus]